MKSKIISGMMLACILVPGFFFFRDLIVESTDPAAIVGKTAEIYERFVAWTTQKNAEHQENQLARDLAKFGAIKDKLRKAIIEAKSAGDEELARDLSDRLADLNEKNKVVVGFRQEVVTELNEQQLRNAEKQLRVAFAAFHAQELDLNLRIADLHAKQADFVAKTNQEDAANLANLFFDVAENGDMKRALELVSPNVKISRDSLSKIASAAKDDFSLERTPNGFDVVVSGRRIFSVGHESDSLRVKRIW